VKLTSKKYKRNKEYESVPFSLCKKYVLFSCPNNYTQQNLSIN